MSDSWRFWMPLSKAVLDPVEQIAGKPKRVIEGVASTEALDLQQEIVVQQGVDASYFRSNGYFNWDHGKKPDSILGLPEDAEVRTIDGRAVFYCKGFLFPEGYEPADKVWSLMKSMAPFGRQLGMSVEGSVLKREGNRIVKSQVRHVSLTHQPVNTETWAQIAKSFTTDRAIPLLKEDLDKVITSILWGDVDNVSCDHFDPRTMKFRSTRDAVEHLVQCLGHSPRSARAALLQLGQSGIW